MTIAWIAIIIWIAYLISKRILSTSVIKNDGDISTSEWIPQGTTIQIGDYQIPGGMIYVSTRAESSKNYFDNEPYLIQTTLQILSSQPDREGQNLSYWPSYSKIPASSRAAYLEWLSQGRRDSSCNIGYVFLFFYGLEHRVLCDAQDDAIARAEIPQIFDEVKELLSVYGENRSFTGYASSFLSYMVMKYQFPIDSLEDSNNFIGSYGDYPLSLKLTLAELALNKKPMPANIALRWFESNPTTSYRTPAKRCNKEFRDLFAIRYNTKYDGGMKLETNKTMISVEYRPACSSLSGDRTVSTSIPDLTKLTQPITAISTLVDSVTNELDAYSRYLCRNSGAENSIGALSYLPIELIRLSNNDTLTMHKKWLIDLLKDNSYSKISVSELLRILGGNLTDIFIFSDIALYLEKLGYGIEPDVRFGGSKLSLNKMAVVFRLGKDIVSAPSNEYSIASAVMFFAAIVSHADGSITYEEEQKLNNHIFNLMHLSHDERIRLAAHLKMLLLTPPSITTIKKWALALNAESRNSIAQLCIAVANADGQIDPAEIKILKKIYELFGLDIGTLFSEIHAHQTKPDELITMALPDQPEVGYVIPKIVSKKKDDGVVLDMNRIAHTLRQTEQVQSLLSNIFISEEELAHVAIVEPIEEDIALVKGLDAIHSRLFKMMSEKPNANRAEFEAWCRELALLPGGAVETLNDAAFDACDDLLVEIEEDILTINEDVLKEMKL